MFRRTSLPLLLALGAFLPVMGMVSHASAATLAQYTFPSETSSETGSAYSATTVASGVTASAIADTSGKTVITTTTGNYVATGPVFKLSPSSSQASLADAMTNGVYADFTITAAAGQFLNLESLTFNVARGGTAGIARGYGITSSILGHDQVLQSGIPTGVQPTMDNVSVDLTSSAYQNISAITFRIYVHTGGSGNTVDFDNITLNGSVVPEPSRAALLMIAGAFLATHRRRSRRPL